MQGIVSIAANRLMEMDVFKLLRENTSMGMATVNVFIAAVWQIIQWVASTVPQVNTKPKKML
jgi:hypothetical protein